MKCLEPQKSRSVSLRIIRQPFIAMKPPVFIESHYLKPSATNVWAKHGTVLRWNRMVYNVFNLRDFEPNNLLYHFLINDILI